MFGVVDKVIETGQDPRRFTEDLLRRLRDLVIVSAVPDAPATGLIDVSEDQGERLVAQAARFGAHDLSRAADLVAAGLTEMRGATAPRLLLELVCARVLLPGADHATDGLAARLDRLERRMTITGVPAQPAPVAAPPAQDRTDRVAAMGDPTPGATQDPAPPPSAAAAAPLDLPAHPRGAAGAGEEPDHPVAESVARATGQVTEPAPPAESPAPPAPPAAPAERAAAAAAPAAAAEPPAGGLTLVDVRRLWPDIVEATKARRRLAWMHLTQNCQVVAVEGSTLTLGFTSSRRPRLLRRGGLRRDPAPGRHRRRRRRLAHRGDRRPRRHARSRTPRRRSPAVRDARPRAAGRPPAPRSSRPGEAASAPDWVGAPARPPRPPPPRRPPEPPGPPQPAGAESRVPAASRPPVAPSEQTRPAGTPASRARTALAAADAAASPDDADADTEALGSAELLARELGAQVIEEIRHS